MTNQQGAPEALRPIARYKIGYATDGWGMRSSTPSGIPHHAGAWVRYEDHVAALVEAQQPAPKASQQAAPSTDQVEEILRERDDAEDFIDALLDEVLGHERPEWSSAYGRADALNDVRERMTALHKPAVDKAWDQFQSTMAAPQQPAPSAAAAQEQHYGPLRDADADWGKKLTVYSPTPQADSQPAPVDMVLHCPKCGVQHIDASEPPVEFEPGAAQWNNPPHRSHLCHGCGHIWRPADVPTNGVAAVKTTGKADSPIAASAPADSVTAPAGGANWAQLRSALAMLMLGWGRNPNQTMDAWYRVLDSATEPGTALAILRTAPDWRDFMAADRAKADSVLEDAARYQWLRNPTTDVALVLDKRTGYVPVDEQVPSVGGYYTYEYRSGAELDAAIDAARKQGANHD